MMSGPGSSNNGETTHFAGLEDKFCKDFTCCGLMLENLHDLLQHFEECHVHVESDGEDDDDHHLPFEFESTDEMDTDMDDAGTPPRLFNLVCSRRCGHVGACNNISNNFVLIYSQLSTPQSIALSDIYSDGISQPGNAPSAFDTSVVRKRSINSPRTMLKKSKSHPGAGPNSSSPIIDVTGNNLRSEPTTIPYSFDGPTQMINDMDVDDEAPGIDNVNNNNTININLHASLSSAIDQPHLHHQHQQSQSASPLLLSSPVTCQNVSATPQPCVNQLPLNNNININNSNNIVVNNYISCNENSSNNASSVSTAPVPSSPALPSNTFSITSSTSASPISNSNNTTIDSVSYGASSSAPASECANSVSESGDEGGKDTDDRPYRCKLDGCEKAYKNPGGLKYHMQHGHCEDTGDPVMNNIIHKPFQCTVEDCGKRYKNLNGLKV